MVQEKEIQAGVARVFNDAAGYYREMRWERNRLAQFEKWLTQTTVEEELGDTQVSNALELGCGPGTWTGLLADRAAHVLAVDLSDAMLGQHAVESFGRWLSPGGRAVVVTKTPISIWRGTGRERWFGPNTLARRLTGRRLNRDFWQRYIPVRGMVRAFQAAGLVDIRVRPVIFGLPIYMRGTKQYPIVPSFAEQPFLSASKNVWTWVSSGSQMRRVAALPLAESYAVSGRQKS
jgi:hypothetical protein